MLKKYVANGLIVVAIFHDLNLAAQYCDKIHLLFNKKIHAYGAPETILTRENIKAVYNIDVVVRKNAFTNSMYITPITPKIPEAAESGYTHQIKRIHVIAGGGSAKQLLPELRGNIVSVGIVNALDDDYEFALELKYEIISEAPFSPISEKSRNELIQKLQQVDLVILTNVPFGKGNLGNLEVLEKCEKPLIILDNTPIETRDFTKGRVSEIYTKLKSKKNVVVVESVQEVLKFIEKQVSG
jgi:iron complex transport system ATP-binding protein